MREIILGAAAAVVLAIATGIWLGTIQEPVADRYTAAYSVRL